MWATRRGTESPKLSRTSLMDGDPYANVQLSEAGGRALTDQGPTARPSAMRDALFEIARGMDLLRSRRNLGLEETRLNFPSTQNMPK